MSAELKTAVVNEALGLSNLFAQNCALKHGIPEKPEKQRVGTLEPDPAPAPQVVVIKSETTTDTTNTPSPGATAAAPDKGSLLRRAAPWLLATAIGTGGAGGLAGYVLGLKPGASTPTVTTPAPNDGSLLQYLQDKGFHRPEGTWQAK